MLSQESTIGILSLLLASATMAAEKISYNREILPIISDKCFHCHGPDAGTREGDLRLDVREDAVKAGAIVPGDPKSSEMIARIHASDSDDVMPPPEAPRQLSDADRATLARWIKEGAEYEPHWSFTPLPALVPVPEAEPATWPRREIDHFVGARLTAEGLTPAPEASPERWLRRVSFDLTGLPPGQAEMSAFLADPSEAAREKVVDQLLASPSFGERMAVDWLDIARYADSFGYQSDLETHAWPYRDWVIRAFNENLAWDQFITWQIAGDLLPEATRDQVIATAFNRIHRMTQEGGSVEAEYRQEGIADRVHTFGTAFLALTFECTRCHDHKYDPLTMKDYYSMGAFFNSIDEWGLLHGTGSIQPSPTLFLTTPEQDREIAARKLAISDEEKILADKVQQQGAAFQAWLETPVATHEWADLSGAYDLDAVDKNLWVNAVDAKAPGKSNERNALVAGRRGQAISFSGDDALTLGKHGVSHAEDPFSVTFWMRPGEQSRRMVVFHHSAGYDPGYNGFELLLEDGRLRWMLARQWPGNCIAIQSQASVPLGEWTHLAVTYDGSSRAAGLKIFLNGKLAESEVLRDQLTKNSGSGSGFSFGERVRDSGFRNGAVDEIRIFKRPLSRLEVAALHAEKPLSEVLATTPRDASGLLDLREFHALALDPETRAAAVRLKDLRVRLRQTMDGVRELPVMKEMAEARPARILARGEYGHPEGDPLPRATPAVLPPLADDQPRNRLGLARWVTAPDHPLTARVQVNRFWQHFFGRGLVATSENFGSQGEVPSHPELLDWLARDFVSKGWDMKRLCRDIVLSATYRQDSKVGENLRKRDPANVLLARGPAKRLPGEALRDQALALAGLLHPSVGGPPAKPYLPDSAAWRVLNSMLPEYKRDAAPGIYRRSLYTFWRRTAPPPGMLVFDVPGRDVCTTARQQTNTPLQPLVMLNDPQFVEAARGLAIRMLREGGGDLATQMRWLFLNCIGRAASPEELSLMAELHAEQTKIFKAAPEDAAAFLKVGELVPPVDIPATDLAAACVLASALLNLDEAITLR